jgi:hypothetical protein
MYFLILHLNINVVQRLDTGKQFGDISPFQQIFSLSAFLVREAVPKLIFETASLVIT